MGVWEDGRGGEGVGVRCGGESRMGEGKGERVERIAIELSWGYLNALLCSAQLMVMVG